MEFREALRKTADVLRQGEIESAEFEATQLVRAIVGRGLAVDGDQWQKILQLVQRRLKKEPLQYILGEWEFYGLPVKVGEGVLIPRADTEALAEEALKLLKPIENPTVFDLCAGSGCIGIALAHYKNAKVTFFEKSPVALKFLKQNTELNSVTAEILEYDVLTAPPCVGKADMIVSNPPYIRQEVIKTLSAEVLREPAMALDGGADGLVFYRHITSAWKPVLKNGGWLLFEIGFDQEAEVTEIMKSAGFSSVHCKKDLGGNPRVVLGQYLF